VEGLKRKRLSQHRELGWLCPVSLALLGLGALAVVAQTLVIRLPCAMSLDYVEGFVRLDAARLAQGGALYGDPSQVPWTVHPYTPVYTALVAAVDGLGRGVAAARGIAYAAILATALLIGLTGQRRTGLVAWGVAALYLTQPLFATWGALARPDSLAVLFSALGVVIVGRYAGGRGVLWALPLFLFAGLTKQSVGAGLLASLLYLLVESPRQVLPFLLLGALGGGAAVLALQLGSGGWFWFHTVEANLNRFNWEQLWALEKLFAGSHWPALVVGSVVLILLVRRRRFPLFGLWFVVASLSTLSGVKVGANLNYFFEALAALAFLIAREFPVHLADRLTRRGRIATPILIACVAVIMAIANLDVHRRSNLHVKEADQIFLDVVEKIGSQEGPMISDDAAILVHSGKPLLFRPFIMTQLAKAGIWDQQPLVNALEQGTIPYVIFRSHPPAIHQDRYTPEMRAALKRYYQRVGNYVLAFPYEVHAPVSVVR